MLGPGKRISAIDDSLYADTNMANLFAFGFSSSRKRTSEPNEGDETPLASEPKTRKDLPSSSDNSKRQFQAKWKENRPWLVYNEEKRVMYCTVCQQYDKSQGRKRNMFITGSTNLRSSALKEHEKCQAHLRSSEAKEAADKPEMSAFMKSLHKMSEDEKAVLLKLFTTALYIALQNKPFTDFPQLLHLQSVNFNCDLTQNYSNGKQAACFIRYLAEAIREDVRSAFHASPFISTIMDGSTDTGNIDEEIVYVRYFNMETFYADCRFLCLKSVCKADAEHLFQVLTSAMENDGSYPEWLESLVCCTADGAAVNFGINNGTIARVKRMKPHVIGLHCTAHRLELAMKSSMKECIYMSTVQTFLEELRKFYHNSPQNWAGLKEAGEALSITVKKLTRASGTRWVAHTEQAIEAVIHNWSALVEHLMQVKITDKADRGRKAAGLYNTLLTLQFVLFLRILKQVVLSNVAVLSCTLQDNKSTVNTVADKVAVCQLRMSAVNITEKLNNFVEDELEAVGNELKYHGHTLVLSGQTRSRGSNKTTKEDVLQQVVRDSTSLVQATVKTLNMRFSEFQDSGSILKAFQIFMPGNWPDTTTALAVYGHNELEQLLDHFGDLLKAKGFNIDGDVCQTELLELFLHCKRLCNIDQSFNNSANALWSQVLKSRQKEDGDAPFPGSTVLALVIIMLVIPVAYAEPERGFSHMGNILRLTGDQS